jgi:hypothetical protein
MDNQPPAAPAAKPRTPASQSTRRSIVYGFAAVAACILAVSGFALKLFPLLLLPLITYGLNVGIIFLGQYLLCNATDAGGALFGSIAPTILTFITAFILKVFPFFRYPIVAVAPTMDVDMKLRLSNAFWFFWAGLIGTLYAGSSAQIC